jgi:chlorobactene glucosyltransferase
MLETLLLVVWLVAFATLLINLLALPGLREDAPTDGALESVVIPARNEAQDIEKTVRAMLAQTYRALEVIVVNDRSTDDTGAILESIRDPRLTVMHGAEPPAGWLGKPWALHQGSVAAKGELLLFVDADIVYRPEAVAGLIDVLERRKVAMAALMPHFAMRGFWENVLLPQLAVLAYMFVPLWLANTTRFVRLGLGAGAGNLIRRDVYQAIGGHEVLRDAVVDDVALGRLVRRHRERTLVVRAERFAEVRMYRGFREVWDGFTKNTFASLGRSYVVAILALPVGFVVHILPYTLALTGSAVSIATVAVISVTRLVLFLVLRYSVLSALFAHPLMMGVWLGILIRSTWRTGVRGELAWRGRTYDAAQTRFGADR